MREIKFRGYDEENNCWRYGWYTRLQKGARKYDAIVCDEDGTLVRYYIHNVATVGQFTGLHDKNGTPIYDGDIVEFIGASGFDDGIAKVIWENSGCWYVENDETNVYDYLDDVAYRCAVIGNIHETPELLNAQ